jgi:hypothetical protein
MMAMFGLPERSDRTCVRSHVTCILKCTAQPTTSRQAARRSSTSTQSAVRDFIMIRIRLTGIGLDRSDSFAADGLSTRGHPSAQPQLPQQLLFNPVISHGPRTAASAGIAEKVSQLIMPG